MSLLPAVARKLSYANVVSTVALVFALGLGTSYAATKLSKNSVTSKAIAPGAVHRSDVAKNAIDSGKVKDGSLGVADLSSKARAALAGKDGAPGVGGAAGASGARGTAVHEAKVAAAQTVEFTPATPSATIALANPAYTQGAFEIDQVMVEMDATATPSGCTAGDPAFSARLTVGGVVLLETLYSMPARLVSTLLAPGTDTPRTLALTVANPSKCSGSFTVKSFTVDVLRFG
ncbi:hypothetical protein [Patulibacter defluvii]|uniref:hypothetical protein n=1 Tax=Patulibacter defluvii TaxID=3095358 RepID=UPI002A750E10|nr:hypothetical protein [Patulibacter sp. DM4]